MDIQKDRIRFQNKRIKDQESILKQQQQEIEKQRKEIEELLFPDSEQGDGHDVNKQKRY